MEVRISYDPERLDVIEGISGDEFREMILKLTHAFRVHYEACGEEVPETARLILQMEGA